MRMEDKVDAVVSKLNSPVSILKNVADTGKNHWLGIELIGKGHRDVVGARISLEVGSVVLMLLGTQWYLLFNVTAGAMAVPADLREAARSFSVTGDVLLPFGFLPNGAFSAILGGRLTGGSTVSNTQGADTVAAVKRAPSGARRRRGPQARP